MQIAQADLDNCGVLDLLRTHVRIARAETAVGSAHALDAAALRTVDIEVWIIPDGKALLEIGALQRLSPDHGEIKSMHTGRAPAARVRKVRCLIILSASPTCMA